MSVGKRQRGFTLLAVLTLTALMAISLSVVGPSWSQARQRERERELVHIGLEYAQALARYRAASPGSERRNPDTLDDLLLDRRFPRVVRHLRRLYPDPLDPGRPWEPVRDPQGGIVGVRSTSTARPLAEHVPHGVQPFSAPAQQYREWVFSVREVE